MTAFWAIAAAMLAAALGLVLPALLARRGAAVQPPRDAAAVTVQVLRDQLAQLDAELAGGGVTPEQHAASKADIERRALDETAADERRPAQDLAPARAARSAVLLAVAVPLLSVGLYALLGNRAALQAAAPVQQAASQPGQPSQQQVEAMVDQLARKMPSQAGKPNELEGWVLLARSQAALQRLEDADRSYARAIALAPRNAALLTDRAEVLIALQGQSGVGEPTKLLEEALQIEPGNLKALALAGSAAMERQDFAAAVDYWGRARRLVEGNSEFAQNLDRGIAEARTAGGGRAASAPSSAVPASAAAGSAVVQGTVRLAPSLAAKVAPGDTVFIFARAAVGPRMPLAIVRRSAVELPIRFKLDDSLAMSPQMRLSNFDRVVVGARISKSGQALPQPGDLVGSSAPVATTGTADAALDIVIDQVQP